MSQGMNRREVLKISGALAAALATGQLGPALQQAAAQAPRPAGAGAPAAPPPGVATVSFRRTIPVRYEVDVFVAGGGPAGIAAALAARSQGASVYLVEGHTCFGGMGTAARVPQFMQFDDGVNFLAGGVGRQVHDRWRQEATYQYSRGIKAEVLKRIYDEMMVASKTEFTFYTNLIAVEAEGGHVQHVICQGKTGPFAVKAKAYIDCTGDGDLAAWAGAPFEKGDAAGLMQPGTLCSLWDNVDWVKVAQSRIPQDSKITEAFRDHVFPYEDLHLPGMYPLGEKMGGGNIGHLFGVDGTDERSLTKALLEGRRQMLAYERYYKRYLKGFEQMELVATGALMGIRESRRILADYVLGGPDFISRAVFEDEIGRYCYPVDIHPSKPERKAYEAFTQEMGQKYHYKRGESYGIPYRILTPKGLHNVLVAGRCVSTDRAMQGSIRVMPGCFITGQAAGMAAALVAGGDGGTRAVDLKELQRRLKAFGAYLPNAKI